MKKIVPAPYIDQTERWVNGCESISSVMLLQAVGIDIDPDTFIARDLPHAPYWEQDGKLYGPDPWQVYLGRVKAELRKKNRRKLSKTRGDAGAPGAIRTRCLMLRRHTLYPSELRAPVLL